MRAGEKPRRLMKGATMSAENLQELFVEEVRDIYDAEKQLVKALPKMARAADSVELRSAFEEHLEITRAHVGRLEEVFKGLGMAARGKTCEGMKGLIEEGQEAMEELQGTVLDAALIASAQKVEHYEIATYGTLATFAEVLGLDDAKDLLGQTLDEEKEADEKLTQIASQINPEAEMGEEGEQAQGEGEGEMASTGARSKSGRSSGGGSRSSSRSKRR
jgi:ferritin-like metal-binding protein YciE